MKVKFDETKEKIAWYALLFSAIALAILTLAFIIVEMPAELYIKAVLAIVTFMTAVYVGSKTKEGGET